MRGWERTGDPRENPLASDIVRHDSHVRESRGDQAVNRTRFTSVEGQDWEFENPTKALTVSGHLDLHEIKRNEGGGRWAWPRPPTPATGSLCAWDAIPARNTHSRTALSRSQDAAASSLTRRTVCRGRLRGVWLIHAGDSLTRRRDAWRPRRERGMASTKRNPSDDRAVAKYEKILLTKPVSSGLLDQLCAAPAEYGQLGRSASSDAIFPPTAATFVEYFNDLRYLTNMAQYWIVPQCTNKAKMKGISFCSIPNDVNIRKQWLHKIRRDDRRSKKISDTMRETTSTHQESTDNSQPSLELPQQSTSGLVCLLAACEIKITADDIEELQPLREELCRQCAIPLRESPDCRAWRVLFQSAGCFAILEGWKMRACRAYGCSNRPIWVNYVSSKGYISTDFQTIANHRKAHYKLTDYDETQKLKMKLLREENLQGHKLKPGTIPTVTTIEKSIGESSSIAGTNTSDYNDRAKIYAIKKHNMSDTDSNISDTDNENVEGNEEGEVGETEIEYPFVSWTYLQALFQSGLELRSIIAVLDHNWNINKDRVGVRTQFSKSSRSWVIRNKYQVSNDGYKKEIMRIIRNLLESGSRRISAEPEVLDLSLPKNIAPTSCPSIGISNYSLKPDFVEKSINKPEFSDLDGRVSATSDNTPHVSLCQASRNRIPLERASRKKSSDTHKTPCDRVKRCGERKIYIKVSERSEPYILNSFLSHLWTALFVHVHLSPLGFEFLLQGPDGGLNLVQSCYPVCPKKEGTPVDKNTETYTLLVTWQNNHGQAHKTTTQNGMTQSRVHFIIVFRFNIFEMERRVQYCSEADAIASTQRKTHLENFDTISSNFSPITSGSEIVAGSDLFWGGAFDGSSGMFTAGIFDRKIPSIFVRIVQLFNHRGHVAVNNRVLPPPGGGGCCVHPCGALSYVPALFTEVSGAPASRNCSKTRPSSPTDNRRRGVRPPFRSPPLVRTYHYPRKHRRRPRQSAVLRTVPNRGVDKYCPTKLTKDLVTVVAFSTTRIELPCHED
ncbi:hypothetical protein PR048_019766 [Dryococelus australis]|uniref:THAP-type domain-containing protein n=1 Tax=Dryococelus australis TaxID=614101 RepID=A0ABQ9H4I0_9NEOP|nr:hypothetical protein PR048_019766 [Dryococelus australis]